MTNGRYARNVRGMSSATDAVKPAPPMMLRAEITPSEWVEIRKLAMDEGKTTQRLIGDTLRALLAKAAA